MGIVPLLRPSISMANFRSTGYVKLRNIVAEPVYVSGVHPPIVFWRMSTLASGWILVSVPPLPIPGPPNAVFGVPRAVPPVHVGDPLLKTVTGLAMEELEIVMFSDWNCVVMLVPAVRVLPAALVSNVRS